MRTEICEQLGIEYPIFAFSHCRDVVAAVSKAGGLGVLGALAFDGDQMEVELSWLDEHLGDKPYGVDIVIPNKYEGMDIDDMTPEGLEAELNKHIPDEHRQFAHKILADHDVPELPPDEHRRDLLGVTAITAAPQVEVLLRHDKVRLVANALGTPPADVVAEIQATGKLVGALCGSVRHALSHKEAGLDFVVCQGTEGGGHCGEVSSVVLWPQVVEAVAPLPVLAAGGVANGAQIAAALAMGAAGVWTGSLWLTVEEADVPPAQMESYLAATSHDTIRSRSYTGKPCRMLANDWTDAWERPDTPDPLPMPLQLMVSLEAVRRGHEYPEQSKKTNFNPVGQVVGMLNHVERAGDVVQRLVEEYIEACERLSALNERALA
ncbi:MAG TPA: nitronate monooxygenase family protein [Acidimicrobiia bacterium]|nr:nitronate monooxygenase family protein [Acidimicrobiia bacterium]